MRRALGAVSADMPHAPAVSGGATANSEAFRFVQAESAAAGARHFFSDILPSGPGTRPGAAPAAVWPR